MGINVIMLLIKLINLANQWMDDELLSKYRCMRNNFIIGTIIKYRLNYFAYYNNIMLFHLFRSKNCNVNNTISGKESKIKKYLNNLVHQP